MKTNNTNKPATLELDELDMMLARELENDARQSNRVLAIKLATSQATVKRRLERLLNEGILTFATITNVTQLEFTIGVVIGLNASPGKIDEVAEYLKSYSSIQRVILTTGRYDIVISMFFNDFSSLAEFFDGDLSHVPHLVDADSMVLIDTLKTSWKYLNDDTEQFRNPQPRDFDELDIRLIKEMELCPRESIKDLGKKLGVNRKLVSRKLQSLMADNVIRVVSIAQPSLFGFNVQVFIFVKVQPGKVRSVAINLAAESRVHAICIITGPFELFLSAVFRDLEEMSDFLRNHLGNYEGVVSHETLIQMGYAKRSYSVFT